MNSSSLYVEIGHHSMAVLHGELGLELALARDEAGKLTAACRGEVVARLRDFLAARGARPRLRALCALGLRGVLLRRVSLPASGKEERPRLLLLQIESEFPLSPDELAWAVSRAAGASRRGSPAREELMVVAIKKEVVEEYSELLAASGATAEFTLAALARSYLCRAPAASYAVLDIGTHASELIAFADGVPAAIRLLHWGEASVAKSIGQALGVSREEAERLKAGLSRTPPVGGAPLSTAQRAADEALDLLAGAVRSQWKGQALFLSGGGVQSGGWAGGLSARLGGIRCERIETGPGEARTAAILGLKAAVERGLSPSPLLLRVNQVKNSEARSKPAPWKWAAAAAALLLAALLWPDAEALIEKPILESKLAALKSGRDRLPEIDRELEFLQDLKESQPPYLDTLAVLAIAAPPGTSLESFSMGRKGDLSIRGKLSNAQQVVQFRAKLVEAGFFSEVTVEEQSPSPDRKVTVRITARLKPAAQRKSISAEALAKVPAQPEQFGAPEPSGLPDGLSLPPGVSLPPGAALPPGFSMPEGSIPPNQPSPGARRSAGRARVRPAEGNPAPVIIMSPDSPVPGQPLETPQ